MKKWMKNKMRRTKKMITRLRKSLPRAMKKVVRDIKEDVMIILSKYHFFLAFLGFLILRLAGGIGILSPSSLGSVILTIFRTNLIFLMLSATSLNF